MTRRTAAADPASTGTTSTSELNCSSANCNPALTNSRPNGTAPPRSVRRRPLLGIRDRNPSVRRYNPCVLAKNLLIQSATLDGTPLNDPLITWEQIQSAATLKFTRGPTRRAGPAIGAPPNPLKVARLHRTFRNLFSNAEYK